MTDMSQCTHSTGSMTGCQPLCTDRATHVVAFNGLELPRCRRHVTPTVNSAYPYRTEVRTLA